MEFRVYKSNNPQIEVKFLIGGELRSLTYNFKGVLQLILDGGLCEGKHILLKYEKNKEEYTFFRDDMRMVVDTGKMVQELFLNYDHTRTYSANFLDVDVIYFKQVEEVEYKDLLKTKDRYTVGSIGMEDEESSLLKIDDSEYKNKSGKIKRDATVFQFEYKETVKLDSLNGKSQSKLGIFKETINSKIRGILNILCVYVLFIIGGSIMGYFNDDLWRYMGNYTAIGMIMGVPITIMYVAGGFDWSNYIDKDSGLLKGKHNIVKNYKHIGEYFISNPKLDDAVNSIKGNMNREVMLSNGYVTRLYELIASDEDKAYVTEDVHVLGNSKDDELDKSLCTTPCLDEEGFYKWYNVLVINSKAEEDYNKNKELVDKLEGEEKLRMEKHMYIVKNKEKQELLRQESEERLGYNIVQNNLQYKVRETNKDLNELYSNLNKREK